MANFAIQFGAALALQLVSSALTPPQRVGKLENKSLPDASYGSEIGLGFGIFPYRASLTHLPAELTETRTRRGKIGGKTVEYTYSATMEFILCEGPIVSSPYMTLNGDPFINFLSDQVQELESSTQNFDKLTLRLGTQTQAPIGALQAIAPNNIAPPNRDLAFVCFPNWGLTEKLGNRPPLVQGLAATTGTIETLSYSKEAPKPIQWGGALDADLSLTNTAQFTAPQSTTFTAPTALTFHICASNPEIRINRAGSSILRTIQHDGTEWIYTQTGSPTEQLTPMSAGQVAQGVFFDIEAGGKLDFYLHGQLLKSISLSDGAEYTITINSTNWAGLEVPKSDTVTVSRFTPEPIALADILQSICDRAAIPCETSEITDLVTGIALTGSGPQDWLGQLQSIYAFLIVDKGGTIHFLNGDRPSTAYHSAPLADFGLEEQDLYRIEQKAPEELPYQCECTYYDLESFQERTAYYRLDTHDESDRPLSDQVLSISTNAVFTREEAQGIAELTLIRAQHERELITLNTTFKYYFLEPGDVLQLPLFGQTIDLLVLESNIGANFEIELKCLRYANDAWQAKRTPIISTTPPTQAANEYARLFVRQGLPKLSANHPDTPIYFAVSHQEPAYSSVSAIASIDGGNSYAQLFSQNAAARVGMTNGFSDADNALTVRVSGELATLSNATYASNQVLNRCAIGNEVLQYQTATLLGEFRGWNYYRLSTLRRGQLGTTAAAHPIWEQFGLAADLTAIAPSDIGDSGTTVLIDLLTDGNEQPLPEASITLA